jgi:hypothetical protein
VLDIPARASFDGAIDADTMHLKGKYVVRERAGC